MIRENNSDSELTADERIAAACRDSGEQVILRAEQTGTPVVVWRDGKVVHLTAAEVRIEATQKKAGLDCDGKHGVRH